MCAQRLRIISCALAVPWTAHATSVQDLVLVPGNRFETLKGDQRGRYSVRVNEQYRITFRFAHGHAHDVRCEDYHV